MIAIDGESVHPAVAGAFNKLNKAFNQATGQRLIVSSGHRSTATQTAWFLSRYRLQSSGGGPYGDVRWWQGRRYVRHSSAGTVAVPGTSLHESYRAIDVRDTGADAGVTTAGTSRANWLRSNAPRFQFNPRGYQFREPWHIEFTGSLTTTAGGDFEPLAPEPEEPPIAAKGNHMTQAIYTTLPATVPADVVATIRGYVGGSNLNLRAGVGVIALVGDAPGTPANVQLTQSDRRGNEWAADHTGALTLEVDGIDIKKGGRKYDFPEFMALLAAYAAPLNVGVVTAAPVGGVSKADVDAAADRVIEAIPTEFTAK